MRNNFVTVKKIIDFYWCSVLLIKSIYTKKYRKIWFWMCAARWQPKILSSCVLGSRKYLYFLSKHRVFKQISSCYHHQSIGGAAHETDVTVLRLPIGICQDKFRFHRSWITKIRLPVRFIFCSDCSDTLSSDSDLSPSSISVWCDCFLQLTHSLTCTYIRIDKSIP